MTYRAGLSYWTKGQRVAPPSARAYQGLVVALRNLQVVVYHAARSKHLPIGHIGNVLIAQKSKLDQAISAKIEE